MELTRRTFVTTAAAASAVAAAATPVIASAAPEDGSAADWRQAPELPTEIAETIDADVVVVGAGNAGLACAAAAAEDGANVVVLEAQSTIQDSRSWVGAVDSTLQHEAGFEYDHAYLANDIARFASYLCDQRLIRLWTDRSGEFMDWLQGIVEHEGYHIMLETACKDSTYYNTAIAHHTYEGEYNPTGEGNYFNRHNKALEAYLGEQGGQILFDTPAVMLVQEDGGRVTGVIAQNEDGDYIQVNAAKGVVMATGGYGNCQELLDELTTTAHRYCSMNIGAERNTGDGTKMLVQAGAHLHPVQETMVFDRGTVIPGSSLGFPFGGGLWYGGTQPFLRVNTAGERYFDEDQTYDYNFNAAVGQPGHTWWQVFDKNYYADCERFQTSRCSRVAAPLEGQAPMVGYLDYHTALNEEYLADALDQQLATGAGVTADTIEELAEQMGVPVETFTATVERYNDLYEAGEDEDFGKKAFRLSAIAEPPFYAVHCAGWLLCTLGSVDVNLDMQPYREDGTVIEGLYAVGNEQAGFYSTVYPETYGGLNNGKGMTFGYLTGKKLAAE